MNKKNVPPTSPLRQMMGEDNNDLSIEDLLNGNDTTVKESKTKGKFKKANPFRIKNWANHDRPENELGDIEELAEEFKNPDIGQQQPCVVRPLNIKGYDYELIVGERRWRAAMKADVDLLIIIENLTDKQAELRQIAENLHREDLSDYATGMSIARLLDSRVLKQKDLQKYFKKFTPVAINRLLAFSQIPKEIWDAVGDMRLVSARTATEIRALLKKGSEYKKAILQLTPHIKDGKVGSTTLVREVEKIIKPKIEKPKNAVEVRSVNGRHLFTWRKDSNRNISISFPKDIRNTIDREKLQDALRKEINKQLDAVKE